MTDEFGWSRGLFSGAVCLGALCGLIISPFAGRLIDRYGSSVILAGSSAVVGVCAVTLAVVSHAWTFYAIYAPGRAMFSSPLELGTSTAVSNWFIRRRPMALALFGAFQGCGLTAVPLVAAVLINYWGWRTAWLSLGVFTLATGVAPALLLMVRRPEDMGLQADPRPAEKSPGSPRFPGSMERVGESAVEGAGTGGLPGSTLWQEANFTVGEALATRAFWMLALFSMAGFVVQAGVSLHQVPHYIGQGVPAHLAALTAGTFAFGQIPGGLFWSSLGRTIPVRVLLSLAALTVGLGAFGTGYSSNLNWGIPAGFTLGFGVGGLHALLRLAWADYYGRQHLGSIRGLTLPAQIGGQAIGPIVAGFMFDATGGYRAPFIIFGVAVSLAALLVLSATPPGRISRLEAPVEAAGG
jgi:MFS family permease